MRIFIIIIICLSSSLYANGQEITKLNATWVDTEIDLDWSDKVGFKLKQSTRFSNFIDEFAVSNTTFKASYQLVDWLRVVGAYRYSYRERNDRKFNRYQLALQAGAKWNDIKWAWRSRYEYRKAIQRDNIQSRWRNRFSASYNIKPLDLDSRIFIEYWYTFEAPMSDFTKYRIGGSLSKEVLKNLDLSVGYSYDSDIDEFEIERENIIVLGLTYKIKRAR